MPIVTVDWWSGSTKSARAQTANDITDAVAKAAQCPREAVTVAIREVDTSYWGTAGTLASDRAHPVKPTMSAG